MMSQQKILNYQIETAPIGVTAGPIFDELAKLESPGDYLGDIEVDFDGRSLPLEFPSIEEAEYMRAGKPDLVIIAARPGNGKSALLCQLAFNLSDYHTCMLFSLEMDKKQIKGRLTALANEKPLNALRGLSVGDLKRAGELLKNRRMFIDDTNGLDVNTLCSRALARHKQTPLSAVFVDYIQIVGTSGRTKTEEVDTVARRLKELALEIQCPVICAAQMSRNIEGRIASAKNKDEVRPLMSDLADSAGLEKWSDVIIFLHKVYVNGVQNPNLVAAYVAKNRHGAMRDFNLYFEGSILRFYDRGFIGGSGI